MITNKTLSLEEILSANDLAPVPIDVPEWGGRVFVGGLSGDARDELEERFGEAGTNIGIRATIVARGLRNEDGTPMEVSAKQVHELGQKSAGVLNRLALRIQELSGMTKEDVEKLEKNLEDAPSGGSG